MVRESGEIPPFSIVGTSAASTGWYSPLASAMKSGSTTRTDRNEPDWLLKNSFIWPGCWIRAMTARPPFFGPSLEPVSVVPVPLAVVSDPQAGGDQHPPVFHTQ